ncbi:uncharacterized protein LOC121412838 [Lytechinus variegatus]|uniref:uncharacterized protein LOC121412838 n=1 Tax=Lytechinus variegatus TaxID=7654 RepID=UPI001BB23D17|nr:uncharacterized protein LOC121412838 [Lytechinus variegatus]
MAILMYAWSPEQNSKQRNTWTGRPSTILLILETFLHMLLSLVIFLAGCPVHVAGSGITQEVTLQAGSRGVVQFHFPWSNNDTFLGVPYYVLRLESQRRPFCVNGKTHIEGFKNQTQAPRFKTLITGLDTTPYVNLIINDVDTLDQDGYIFTAIFHHSLEHVQYETVKKKVFVQIPHGPAKCFITISENVVLTYEAHCRATSGSGATTISCYQNGQKLQSRNGIAVDGKFTRGIFVLLFDTRFACCSHDLTSVVSAATCSDFEWPPRTPNAVTTTRIPNTVPKFVNSTSRRPVGDVTNPTTHIKYHADSGARKYIGDKLSWHKQIDVVCNPKV